MHSSNADDFAPFGVGEFSKEMSVKCESAVADSESLSAESEESARISVESADSKNDLDVMQAFGKTKARHPLNFM